MPTRDGQVLQLAVAVGHADRADVIALGEEQLDDHPAVFAEAFGVSVWTSMPSCTVVTQAGCKLARARDLDQAQPASRHFARRHRDGTASGSRCRPRAPPSRIVSSSRALTSWPSIVRVRSFHLAMRHGLLDSPSDGRSSGSHRSAAIRFSVSDVVLVAEVAQRAEHRVRRRLAQAAQAGVLAPCRRAIPAAPNPSASPRPSMILRQQAMHLHGARAAGNALAARLVHAELHEEAGDIDHVRSSRP